MFHQVQRFLVTNWPRLLGVYPQFLDAATPEYGNCLTKMHFATDSQGFCEIEPGYIPGPLTEFPHFDLFLFLL
jgi:hypothetical protein